MKFTIIGMMAEVIEGKNGNLIMQANEDLHNSIRLASGKNAGVCYMKDSYFGSAVVDEEKASKRCSTVWTSGHHSVSGHERVKVLLEGIPKALAMLLNNLQNYDTSEKSGRYTEMRGSSALEQEMYEKWHKKMNEVLAEKLSSIDEKKRNKLAMENARYFLSVFAPSTTMLYTTSVREWNYIVDWIDKYREDYKSKATSDFEKKYHFDEQLLESLEWLKDEIVKSILYFPELRDNKQYTFHTFHEDYLFRDNDAEKNEIVMGTFFKKGKGSFAMLAQLQRHRTGRVQMLVDSEEESFFIPKILDGEIKKEWERDMRTMLDSGILTVGYEVNYFYSIALDKMVLMLKERLCGAAQLEIRDFAFDITRYVHKAIKENVEILCDDNTREFFIKAIDERGRITTKCKYIKCDNPCAFIKKLPNAELI